MLPPDATQRALDRMHATAWISSEMTVEHLEKELGASRERIAALEERIKAYEAAELKRARAEAQEKVHMHEPCGPDCPRNNDLNPDAPVTERRPPVGLESRA